MASSITGIVTRIGKGFDTNDSTVVIIELMTRRTGAVMTFLAYGANMKLALSFLNTGGMYTVDYEAWSDSLWDGEAVGFNTV